MSVTETADRTRDRLVILVDHLIEHTQGHADHLIKVRGDLGEHAKAMGLLDQALADLAVAQRSLSAFRDSVIVGD